MLMPIASNGAAKAAKSTSSIPQCTDAVNLLHFGRARLVSDRRLIGLPGEYRGLAGVRCNATCRFRCFSGLLTYPRFFLTALIASQLLQKGLAFSMQASHMFMTTLSIMPRQPTFHRDAKQIKPMQPRPNPGGPEQPVWAHAAQTPPFPWWQRARRKDSAGLV